MRIKMKMVFWKKIHCKIDNIPLFSSSTNKSVIFYASLQIQALNPEPERLVRHGAELMHMLNTPGKTPMNIQKGSNKYR